MPDGLARGLPAGLNPVAGPCAHMFGVAGGALFTGASFTAIQGTGAMAIIVADVNSGRVGAAMGKRDRTSPRSGS